ncbi:AMP-binding protein [Sessilibacter corallicola]|uniref:AMP-binding protein n=1 Tax=Sessilibacter corallicola TaxID=2904075 RepID=UPI001E4BD79D|nr:AMP-binding protein [Sessilibacter corallicola]MCE2028098.1 AMP-binding protein [Sessilibacter corallicola]
MDLSNVLFYQHTPSSSPVSEALSYSDNCSTISLALAAAKAFEQFTGDLPSQLLIRDNTHDSQVSIYLCHWQDHEVSIRKYHGISNDADIAVNTQYRYPLVIGETTLNEPLSDCASLTLHDGNLRFEFDSSRLLPSGVRIFLDGIRQLIPLFELQSNTSEAGAWVYTIKNNGDHDGNCLDYHELQNRLFPYKPGENTTPLFQQLLTAIEANRDKIAIIDNAKNHSFGDLCVEIYFCCQMLRQHNITAGDAVGVAIDRGRNLFVLMAACAALNLVYVPIDNTLTHTEIQRRIEQIQPKIFFTDDLLSAPVADEVVVISAEFNFCQNKHCHYDDALSSLWQIADSGNSTQQLLSPFTVLFTSGSTGQAKAVVHHQQSFINRFTWMWQQAPFEPHDLLGQRTDIGFGPHLWEYWGPLLQGVTIAVIERAVFSDPSALANCVYQHQITRLSFVPSQLKYIFASLDSAQVSEKLTSLSLLSFAGEPLSITDYNHLKCLMPNTTFFSDFGTTETNTLFFERLHFKTPNSAQLNRLGQPNPTVDIRIVDNNGNACAPFQPGFLSVRGESLALGYLNKGIVPLAQAADYYPTGDRVFFDDGGFIVNLGRNDDQIKTRGIRINLSGLSTRLSQLLPTVEFRLLIRETQSQEKQIFFVYSSSQYTPIDLQRITSQKLPLNQRPTFFYQVDHLPLLPNGKLDRQTILTSIQQQDNDLGNTLSDQLLKTFRQLTELPLSHELAMHSDFAELGIHSLQMVELLSQINTQFNLELSPTDLLENADFKSLLSLIEQQTENTPNLNNSNKVNDLVQKTQIQVRGDLETLSKTITKRKQLKGIRKNRPKIALVTGSTGFLGPFLIEDLLSKNFDKIYCFVRAENTISAQLKFTTNAARYQLSNLTENRGITFIPLSHDCELEPHLLNTLSEITHIYHTAADVNHLADYSALSDGNNKLWHLIINIINHSEVESLLFTSSIAACRFSSGETHSPETLHDQPEEISSGYGISKWLGEQLCHNIHQRTGISTSIIRAGEITAHNDTGTGRTDDIIHNLLILFTLVGVCPSRNNLENLFFDAVPINVATKFITQSSSRTTFAVSHLLPYEALSLADTLQFLGVTSDNNLSRNSWFEKIHQAAEHHKNNLLSGISLFTDSSRGKPLWFDYFLKISLNRNSSLNDIAFSSHSFQSVKQRADVMRARKCASSESVTTENPCD